MILEMSQRGADKLVQCMRNKKKATSSRLHGFKSGYFDVILFFHLPTRSEQRPVVHLYSCHVISKKKKRKKKQHCVTATWRQRSQCGRLVVTTVVKVSEAQCEMLWSSCPRCHLQESKLHRMWPLTTINGDGCALRGRRSREQHPEKNTASEVFEDFKIKTSPLLNTKMSSCWDLRYDWNAIMIRNENTRLSDKHFASTMREERKKQNKATADSWGKDWCQGKCLNLSCLSDSLSDPRSVQRRDK